MPDSPAIQPFISAVVAFHFGRDILRPCVESLLNQDYPKDRYEIIMVDNGSNDGTDVIVAEYPVRLLYEREAKTPYAGLNLGIQQAQGDIIAITGADCVADPHWLEELAKGFASKDVVGVAGVIAPYPSEDLISSFFGDMLRHHAPEADELFAVPTGNVAYCRQALVEVGLFDGVWIGGADVDLSWRIQAHTGGRIVYNPEAIVFHKYRTTVRGLFKQFRRYGFNEIVLATLHKGQLYHQWTPKYHLIWMLRQVWALVTYVRSAIYRTLTWPIHRRDRKYLLWPLLWLVAESGSLLGKLEGLVATRFFTRNPFPSRPDIVR